LYRSSLELAHIFVTFLHMRKDTANEVASIIISARERLRRSLPTPKPSSDSLNDESGRSRTYVNEGDGIEDASISSGVATVDDSTSRSTIDDEEDHNIPRTMNTGAKYDPYKNKWIFPSSNSPHTMSRMTAYLSKVDWRVFNYITKYFLQNGTTFCILHKRRTVVLSIGTMITGHALEFSTVLLMDLV
jgi:hypothetical protein